VRLGVSAARALGPLTDHRGWPPGHPHQLHRPTYSLVPFNVTGQYFTFQGFRAAFNRSATPHQNFTVTKATMAEFPVLNESVSYATLSFPVLNPTHTHPRASELLRVLCGMLSDTANKLYTQDLAYGDMFVFLKGIVHWQCNKGSEPAMALSAFGSAAPGLVSVPVTIFSTAIDDDILAKSFKTNVQTVQKLKAALAPPSAQVKGITLHVLLCLSCSYMAMLCHLCDTSSVTVTATVFLQQYYFYSASTM
jgi:quercetin dioxygenase-like cupin family protein